MESTRLLLVIGSEPDRALREQLGAAGWAMHRAADLAAAAASMRETRFLVGLLIESRMDAAFCAKADAFLREHPEPAWVIVTTAQRPGELAPAAEALILDHAFDHHHLPLDVARLQGTLGHAFGHAQLRQRRARREQSAPPLVGHGVATSAELRRIARIAKADAPVLISGERGIGKTLAAQAIHAASDRAAGPFVPVHCGTIASSLARAELFDLFDSARHGTLFLAEIGELPPEHQTALLRWLQQTALARVSPVHGRATEARLIASTAMDLVARAASGDFREDLLLRLNALPLPLTPLRERRQDITPLALHICHQFAHEKKASLRGFSSRALSALRSHAWPGNIRELVDRVRRAMVMAEGRSMTPQDLGLADAAAQDPPERLDEVRRRAEYGAIVAGLQHTGHNVTQAARRLGVSRMTLYRLLEKHGIRLQG